MSGPFNQINTNSPLSPQPRDNNPVSFRTNVNRAKTKRWVEAKKYSYDGDDWGEDEYGEYEYDDEPLQSQNQRTGANQSTPDISSTLPQDRSHPPLPSMDRARSMERVQTMPTESSAASSNSPASIVRPADIYKRMREDQDVRQPSPVDPATSEPTPVARASTLPVHASSAPAPPVEGTRQYQAETEGLDKSIPHGAEAPELSLPDVKRLSAFNPDFFGDPSSTPQNVQDPGSQPHQLQHNPSLGFRSAVNQAFDVPETPSTVADSVARSNSDSTTGISPIIPRRDTFDDKTPTILEDPNENNETPSQGDVVLKPGHRRDLSIPSPGNSPSRRPIIAGPDASASSELGQLSGETPAESPWEASSQPTQSNTILPSQETSERDLPAPLSVQTNVAPGPPTAPKENVPVIIPSMSTENSPEDTENDRLRKEIIRSLSRENTPSDQQDQTPPQTSGQDTLIPREYESYWSGQQPTGPSEPQPFTSSTPTVTAIPSTEPSAPIPLKGPRPKLKKRFSWEESSDDDESTPVVTQAEPSRPPPMPGQYPFSQDSVLPESVVTPPASQVPETAGDIGGRDEPAPEKPKLTVVPPVAMDFASIPSSDHVNESIEPVQPIQSQTTETLARAEEGQSSSPTQSFAEAPARIPSTSVESGLLGFKEILGMQSSDERVQAFNRTRDQFAAIDTGLSHWVQVTVQAHPEHSDVVERNAKPLSDEFKNSVPRAKFPKLSSLGNLASSLQDGSHSPSGHIRRPSAHLGTVKQHQGTKDFLHSAGVLGGQAGKAAKGLFSKGRSKLKGGGSEKGFQSMRGYHRPIRLSDLELDLDPSQDLHDLPSSRPLTTTRSANNAATTRSGGALFVPPPVPGVPTNRQSGGQQRPAGPSDPCPIINSKNDDARFIAEGQADGIQGRPRVLQHQLPSVSSLGLQDTDLDPPPPPLAQKLAQDKHDQSASLVSLPSDQGDAQPPLLGDRTRRWSDSTGQGTGNHNKNLSVNPLAQREAVRHSTGSRLSPIPTSPQHDWRHRPEQRSSSRDPALHRTSLLLLPPMEKLKNVGRFRRTPKETNQPESRHAQPQKKPFIKLTGLFSRTHQAKFGPPKQFQSSSDTSAGQYLAPVASSPDSRIASSSISSIENHERSISLPDRRNNIHARRAPPEGYFAHESPETFSVARPHQHIRSASSPDRTRLSDPYPVDPRRLSPQSPPYHSSATPQRQPRATSPRHSSPLPSPRTPPSRGRSEDRTYAQELHLRSRSPKAFAPRPEERNLPKHDPTDPAYKLGTFRSSNPRTSRVGDQELPWKITIPGDTEEATANTSASWRRETEGVLNGTRLPTYQEDVEEHGTLQRTPDEKRAPLFPDPPTVPDEPIPSQTNPTSPNHPHRSGARAINSLETPVELPVRTDDNSSEEIMMSSTAYPGQEWRPLGFSEWEHQ